MAHFSCSLALHSFIFWILIFEASGNDGDPFRSLQQFIENRQTDTGSVPKMHTLFSVECGPYFDWQTIGVMHSYRKSGHPGPITRLLSCTEEDLAKYPNMDLAPTFVVPSWTLHPRTHDLYPAINKPKGVLDWIERSKDSQNVDWVVILDADMIIRAPITPWDLKAGKGRPVAASYGYLIGCDNILAQLHTKNPHLCDKVGGFLVLHVDDIRTLAPLWLAKTEEVRADRAHYATNITGDVYGQGWISEMYGYSFGAAECGLRHQIDNDLMLYPGYEPQQDPKLLHYGLPFSVGGWNFDKSAHGNDHIVNECNKLFDQPPFPQDVNEPIEGKRLGALLNIECVNTLNEGLLIHHAIHNCPEPAPSSYVTYLKENIRKAMKNDRNVGAGSLLRGTTDEPMEKLARRFLDSTSSGLVSTNRTQAGKEKAIDTTDLPEITKAGGSEGQEGTDRTDSGSDVTAREDTASESVTNNVSGGDPESKDGESGGQEKQEPDRIEEGDGQDEQVPQNKEGTNGQDTQVTQNDEQINGKDEQVSQETEEIDGQDKQESQDKDETDDEDKQESQKNTDGDREGNGAEVNTAEGTGGNSSSESNSTTVQKGEGVEDRSTLEILYPPGAIVKPDPATWQPRQVAGRPKIITLFSVECNSYFDWQTLGVMYSLKRSGHPGPITRLLSCTPQDLEKYRGMDLAPTMVVPSWSRHPITGEWYAAINKPVGVNHWLENSPDAKEVEWVVILDADMLIRGPILPWDLGAEKGRPVSAPYDYLIGCDNILGQLHMKNPLVCDKVGGYIVMHIDDLKKFAPLWLSKTEEVRADKAHYATNITGDVYGEGWISEMYGYSFGASDAGLRHKRVNTVMLYPGYFPLPKIDPVLLHYGLTFSVLNWTWDKAKWHTPDLASQCGSHFPDPPDPSLLPQGQDSEARRRDLISIECVAVLNRAIRENHRKLGCPLEGEIDVGNLDLGLASPDKPYDSPPEKEKVVVVEQGELVEGFQTVEHVGFVGEEKGMFVTLEKSKGVDGKGGESESESGGGEVTQGDETKVQSGAEVDEGDSDDQTQHEVKDIAQEVKEEARKRERERKLKDDEDEVQEKDTVNGRQFSHEERGDLISKRRAIDSVLPESPNWSIALPWTLLLVMVLYILFSRKVLRLFGRGADRSKRRAGGVWGRLMRFSWLSRVSLPLASTEDSLKDTNA